MSRFMDAINALDGDSRVDYLEKKVNVLIREVAFLDRLIELQATNYLLKRHEAVNSDNKKVIKA